MDGPTEENKPENEGRKEEEDGCEKASLHQLTEPRDQEAGQRGDDITGRTLPCICHGATKRSEANLVYPAETGSPISRRRESRPVVERPGTSGRILISAPASARAARSSGSSDSGV